MKDIQKKPPWALPKGWRQRKDWPHTHMWHLKIWRNKRGFIEKEIKYRLSPQFFFTLVSQVSSFFFFFLTSVRQLCSIFKTVDSKEEVRARGFRAHCQEASNKQQWPSSTWGSLGCRIVEFLLYDLYFLISWKVFKVKVCILQ